MISVLEHADLILHGIEASELSAALSDVIYDFRRVRCSVRRGSVGRCQIVIDKLIQGDSIVNNIIDRIRALDGVTIAKIETQ